MENQFYQFYFSHFSEKARFALDICDHSYEPVILIPGAHALKVSKFAKSTSLPILKLKDKVVQGSSEIINYLIQKHPAKNLQVNDLSLEKEMDDSFGKGTQVLLYFHILDNHEMLIQLFGGGDPKKEKLLRRLGLDHIANGLVELYQLSEDSYNEYRNKLEQTLKKTDSLLKGNGFLNGDHLTRLDITMAGLLSVWDVPKQHPYFDIVKKLNFPNSIQHVRNQIIKSTTFSKVKEIYERFR